MAVSNLVRLQAKMTQLGLETGGHQDSDTTATFPCGGTGEVPAHFPLLLKLHSTKFCSSPTSTDWIKWCAIGC